MVDKPQGISKITVSGFKSLYDETSIDIRPLTILAGANSSGKSSIMQPLLLMKQTLESEYTPNVFLLNGPNVRYTSASQFFHIDKPKSEFIVSLDIDNIGKLSNSYKNTKNKLQIKETWFVATNKNAFKSKSGDIVREIKLAPDVLYKRTVSQFPVELHDLRDALQNMTVGGDILYNFRANRCFLNIEMVFKDGTLAMEGDPLPLAFFPVHSFSHYIQDIIHVPGLRDNPERSYPVASVDGNFKGTFNNYFASIIADWGDDEETHKAFSLSLLDNMMTLGLSDGRRCRRSNSRICDGNCSCRSSSDARRDR